MAYMGVSNVTAKKLYYKVEFMVCKSWRNHAIKANIPSIYRYNSQVLIRLVSSGKVSSRTVNTTTAFRKNKKLSIC
jgi:hypothetical protein